MIPLFSALRKLASDVVTGSRCRPVLLQWCSRNHQKHHPLHVQCRGDDPGGLQGSSTIEIKMPCARPRLGTWSSRPGFLPADHQLITHTSCMCTVKVLTKLEATDGGAAPTIPQVCGGVRRWVGGSLAHATNRASLDSAPCTTEAAVLPSASRSSCSTSTPSRRSAPRTGASRSRCWCAASHHYASVCTDPSSTRLTLGKACGCCHVVVPCIPRSLPMYISGHLPQGG